MMDCWCCGLPNVLLVVTRPPVFCWIILQRALVVEGFVSICPMIWKFLWPYCQMILHVFYKKRGWIQVYMRCAHRVYLGYTPCSTGNVQVLGRYTRLDFHTVPRISVAVVFVDN